jgi:hypothetical protein
MSDPNQEVAPLIPVEERAIEFYEDNITAVAVEVEGQRRVFVPVRPVCEHLGLIWSSQFMRIQRDPVLSQVHRSVLITRTESGEREMLCLPIEYLNGFLFGISVNRVKEELREKVIRYQRDCYLVLYEAFQSKALGSADEDLGSQMMAPVQTEPSAQLLQIREMGLTIVRMAEQQLALEQRVSTTEARLDRAALFFTDLNRRLSTVERRLTPASHITEEQAAEVSALVKSLAELLTGKGKGNAYQGVFSELYRRFGVSSYHHIRQAQYEEVLSFLEDWREVASREGQ